MNFYSIGLGIIIIAAVAALIMILEKQSRQTPVSGKEEMLGMEGEARSNLNPYGFVFINGELWKAKSAGPEINKGETVKVIEIKKLLLEVEKINKEE